MNVPPPAQDRPRRPLQRLRRLGSSAWPMPALSVLLFAAWPMLNGSWSAGHLVLAAALAWVIPLLVRRFHPERPRPGAPAATARLAGRVLRDIVVSNVDVARRVLGREAAIRPRFVWVPLTLRDPHGIVALAGIITLTPGTLSSELSDDRRFLLVHVLHCPDDEAEAALVATVGERYEAPLREIFE